MHAFLIFSVDFNGHEAIFHIFFPVFFMDDNSSRGSLTLLTELCPFFLGFISDLSSKDDQCMAAALSLASSLNIFLLTYGCI